MNELEPSPVEETPPSWPVTSDEVDVENRSKRDYFGPSRSTTSILGLRSSSIPNILIALQKYSTIPPSIYLVMHYSNTAIFPLITRSITSSERLLLLTRPYYQSFPLEPLLIFLPVATHVISGLGLRLYRRSIAARRYGAETSLQRHQIRKSLWPKLSLTSALGYTLFPMLFGHVLVNRIIPEQLHGDSSVVGLRFFSHGVSRHPWFANIGYAVMLGVASWHFVTGAAKYLKLSRESVTEGGDYGIRKRKNRDRTINGIAAAVASIWIVSGLGIVGTGIGGIAPAAWEVKEWNNVYKSIPVIGGWM